MSKKLQYRESYNCHKHVVMPGMEININWDSMRSKNDPAPPWTCAVFGLYVGNFAEFEEAETAAIAYAKKFADALKARTDKL